MNLLAVVGAFIITLSFLAYGIGSISLIRFKMVGSVVLIFLSLGTIFDLSAIMLMIQGSEGTPFTVHGFLGYTAFLLMFIGTAAVWRLYFVKGLDTPVTRKLQAYNKVAYLFWVLAYFTGSLIVIWR